MQDHVPLRKRVPLQLRKVLKKTFGSLVQLTIGWLFLSFPVWGVLWGGWMKNPEIMGNPTLLTAGWVLLFILLFIARCAYQYLYYLTYYYDIDEKNLIIRKGVVTKREMILPFAKVTDVSVDQDVMDVMLGLYDVHFSTPTVDSGQFAHIDGLNRRGAQEVRQMILDMINQVQYDKNAP